EALKRSGGVDAVVRHPTAIDVQHLLGPGALQRDAYIRPQDIAVIGEALKHDSSPDVFTILPAQTVVHALAVEGKHELFMEKYTKGSIRGRLERERARQRRGPAARKAKSEALRDAIRQVLAHGTPPTPSAVLRALEKIEEARKLLYTKRGKEISVKTI